MPTSDAIRIEGLQKRYRGKRGEKHALKGVSLTVPRGSFFGLLGPNGAGKSTLINIMAGLVLKTSGSVEICGHDLDRDTRGARLSIGVVPQELVLDTFFTVREALEFHAGYYGVPTSLRRTDELIQAMGLADKADASSRQLSGGMRRRLLIAKALVHNPPVVILDEPTAGVDVELREQLWEYVKKLNRQGTTVLLTTHYLEEAQTLCDSIAILNHGEIVANEAKETLLARYGAKVLTVILDQPPVILPTAIRALACGAKLEGNTLTVPFSKDDQQLQTVLDVLHNERLSVRDIRVEEPDLETAFRRLTRAAA